MTSAGPIHFKVGAGTDPEDEQGDRYAREAEELGGKAGYPSKQDKGIDTGKGAEPGRGAENTMTPQLGGKSYNDNLSTPRLAPGPIKESEGPAGGDGAVFGVLSWGYVVMALLAFIAPHQTAELFYGAKALPHDWLHEPLFRLLASGLLTAATVCQAVKSSIDKGRVTMPTTQHLISGLLLFSTANAGLALMVRDMLTPKAMALNGVVFALTGVLAAYQRAQTTGLKTLVSGAFGLIPGLLKVRNLMSLLYSVLTVSFALSGLSYIFGPERSLSGVFGYVKGADCLVTWQAIGGGLLLVSSVAYALKDAAYRSRLGAGVHKLLNTGLAIASAAHVAILFPLYRAASGGPYLPALLGTWTISLLTTVLGLFADKPSDD